MAHDVNQSEKDVAAQLRSALVDRISSERYDLWIPENTTWSWADNQLTLTFPNKFSSQLAKKMLHRDLREVALEVTGSHIDTVFSAADVASMSDNQANSAQSTRSSGGNRSAVSGVPAANAIQLHGGGQENAPQERATRETSNLRRGQRTAMPIVASESAPRQPSANASETTQVLWDRFVRGASNELAWTTANLAVNEPGRLTPVLFHGPSGCGKSLLAAAITQQLRGERRMRRVVHMTSEQFTNDFMEGLRGGGLPMFRRKYRDVEALILDDVQFFIGKKSTLAEVKHTLDNLLRLGKQVVFTADRSLNELQALGNDLIGRLRGGLVAPLFPLDQATRIEVLERLLEEENVVIDQDVVQQLASRTAGDGRVLSGIVKRLTAMSSLESTKLTWDGCWNAVYDLVQATQPVVRIGDIERVVCNIFGLEANSLQSSSKMRTVSQPRMLAMFLARKYTPAAYKEIGEYFGKRRHSTVISAEKTVEGWLTEGTDVNFGRGLTVRDALRHVESQLQVG